MRWFFLTLLVGAAMIGAQYVIAQYAVVDLTPSQVIIKNDSSQSILNIGNCSGGNCLLICGANGSVGNCSGAAFILYPFTDQTGSVGLRAQRFFEADFLRWYNGSSDYIVTAHNHSGGAGSGDPIPHNCTERQSPAKNTTYLNNRTRAIMVFSSFTSEYDIIGDSMALGLMRVGKEARPLYLFASCGERATSNIGVAAVYDIDVTCMAIVPPFTNYTIDQSATGAASIIMRQIQECEL